MNPEELKKKKAEFIANSPKGFVEALKTKHPIAIDINRRLNQYGTVSQKQVDLVFKLNRDVMEKKPVIVGKKMVVEGIVTSSRIVDTQYGLVRKISVHDDRGFVVYGSAPKKKMFTSGMRIKMVADTRISNTDPTFGFFSHAKLVEEGK